MRVLEVPRFEDYEYETIEDSANRLAWLGNGYTYNEQHMVGDRAWYVTEAWQNPINPKPAAMSNGI